MKSFKYIVLVALSVSFLFSSCDKDKEAPTIIVDTPAEHTDFHTQDEVHVTATANDDKELASYTLEIGDADGEHIDGFHHDETGSLSGKAAEIHTHFTIPDSVSVSMFYVHITVMDAEGKTGSVAHMLHVH